MAWSSAQTLPGPALSDWDRKREDVLSSVERRIGSRHDRERPGHLHGSEDRGGANALRALANHPIHRGTHAGPVERELPMISLNALVSVAVPEPPVAVNLMVPLS